MNTHILTSITNGLGNIILNSEKTLNALSQDMAEELFATLDLWENDSNVSCIFLEGSGSKAFCAGGDIKNLYHALKDDKKKKTDINPTCLKFFLTEYALDYKIHTYKKPIITWNHGITMGGGMGLMNGASHRIVTDTSLLAMPEVSIGLYPDVGATYFLNRTPPGFAQFLGVTGARFNGSDAIELGVADYYLKSTNKESLVTSLNNISWTNNTHSNKALIDLVLKELSEINIPHSQVIDFKDHFKELENTTCVNEFIQITNSFPQSEWFQNSLSIFRRGSPTSAAIILEQLKHGKKLTLKEAFKSELNLSVHCSLRPDFFEGVRSLLIDKDLSPKWSPATVDELTPDYVNSFFTPIWKDKDHPFNNWID